MLYQTHVDLIFKEEPESSRNKYTHPVAGHSPQCKVIVLESELENGFFNECILISHFMLLLMHL